MRLFWVAGLYFTIRFPFYIHTDSPNGSSYNLFSQRAPLRSYSYGAVPCILHSLGMFDSVRYSRSRKLVS